MSKRRFRIVTALLLLLLIAAIANYFFVYHAYNDAVKALPLTAQQAPAAPIDVTVANAPHHHEPSFVSGVQPIGPGWYGELYLSKASQGGYDIVVDAYASGSRTKTDVEAVEIDVRQPGAASAQLTPAITRKETGEFTAHADFPSNGTWEVRVRMHRGNQTLEFGEKFDLKD